MKRRSLASSVWLLLAATSCAMWQADVVQVNTGGLRFEFPPGVIRKSEPNHVLYEVSAGPLVEFRDGKLFLDGVDRGPLTSGDHVRLRADGSLFVNGTPVGGARR